MTRLRSLHPAPKKLAAQFIPVALISLLPLTGCLPEQSCGCTREIRFNFCLTAQGGKPLPDTLHYVRETPANNGTGASIRDTLNREVNGTCFDEHTGRQRVLVYSKDSLIHQTEWIHVHAVDCCHSEDTTLVLPL